MKYKYQVLVNIVILVLFSGFIIYFIKIDNEKNNSSVYYLTSEELEEIDKVYEELIKFCEENQNLSIMEADIPYEEYIELENRITNSDWIKISQTLRFDEVRPWLVQYYYDSWDTYICTVFYMVEEEEVIDEFLSCRYQKYLYKKINNHLYVCLDRLQHE
ncbi:MAG: hypothetical protein HDT39_08050 [Lachnospiraceae bacterium]|nr:hypothetical protein [Lachnospiraceae bacterium]